MGALIITGLVFFAIIAWLKSDYALYLIILLLPAYQIRFQAGLLPMTFLEAMILVLASIMSLRGVRHWWMTRQPPRLLHFVRNDKTTFVFIILFLLAAAISVFVSPVTVKAAGIFKAYFLEAVLFYFVVLAIVDSRKKLDHLFASLGILAIYVSAFGVYQFFTLQHLPFSWWGVEISSRRIISVLNHPNALALLLGPILAMLIFLKRSKLFIAAITLGTIAFYLSLSRAGWLALVAILLIFSSPLMGEVRWGWKKLLLSLSVIVTIILVIPFSRDKILELARAHDPSRENRFVLWTAAIDMLKKSPVTGAGLMGFHEYYQNYPLGPDRVVQNYPHNFFLTFWVETGLLGLVSMIGLIILFYKKIRNLMRSEYRSLALAAGAGMAMIVLHSLVDVSYFKNDLAVLFWLIYALPELRLSA